MVDSAGKLRRTFGPVKEGVARTGSFPQRLITHGGGDTFWAGPAAGESEAYVLEEWGIDGILRRSFRRDASWYESRGDGKLAPTVGPLHTDGSGLLFVAVILPTKEYVEYMEGKRKRRRQGGGFEDDEDREMSLLDFSLEMFDVRTGELLASDRFAGKKMLEEAPDGFFRGRMEGFRFREEGTDGLPFVEIVEIHLVGK